jgi:hypothetical protein
MEIYCSTTAMRIESVIQINAPKEIAWVVTDEVQRRPE